jgi:alkylhydroperoxidase/carboxymuconolactone decarboxylase family protein YurZ
MTTGPSLSPLEYVKQFSNDTGVAFQAWRKAVLSSGPLDAQTCELIVLGALVTSGGESSFKVHARRLLGEGVAAEALRQAVFVTLGASTTLVQVIAGLRWIDAVLAEGSATDAR